MAGTDLEKHDSGAVVHHPVPTYNPDAPSEAWGWHGQWSNFALRGRRLLLGLGVVGLVLMLLGNQQSHVEDYYLVAFALVLAVWSFRTERDVRRRRRIKP